MNLLESMQKRHAVRDYNDEPLTAEQVNTLDEAIAAANAKQGLDIQLIHDVDDAFGGCPTHYGRFKNVHNLIALIGTDSPSNEAILDEKVGHAGQLLALTAVSLGLDTSGWYCMRPLIMTARGRSPKGNVCPPPLRSGMATAPAGRIAANRLRNWEP